VALRHDADSPFYQTGWRPAWVGLVTLVLLLAGSLSYVTAESADTRVRVRSFYGSLRVVETSLPKVRWIEGEKVQDFPAGLRLRKLRHGTIDHGIQYLTDDRRRQPTAYYVERSGVAVALREAASRGPMRVGVVGLGTGTLAVFGRPGDVIRFYEINPQVTELARREFTYLSDSPAKIEVVPGDARLSMEREPPQNYDVLAVDAFSGDAIPIHLLTREAVALYFRHLRPGGVLALHLSNQHLSLPPVARRIAEALGKKALLVESTADDPSGAFRAYWVLVSDRAEFYRDPAVAAVTRQVLDRPDLPLWTDDYSNLLRVWK
jgi:SAM-dependent methyltransferase